MPIRKDLKPLYPPDWQAVSAGIRFGRAAGRCERCGRPHGQCVLVCDDGTWIDPQDGRQYDGAGRCLGVRPVHDWPAGHFTVTVLTCAHLDQNPAHNAPTNLAALCQRCHLRHDRRQHVISAWRTRRHRKAVGELFR